MANEIIYKNLCENLNHLRCALYFIVGIKWNLKQGEWSLYLKDKDNPEEFELPAQIRRRNLDNMLELFNEAGYSTALVYKFKWNSFGEAGRLIIRDKKKIVLTEKDGFWGRFLGNKEYVRGAVMDELEEEGLVEKIQKEY